MVAFFVSNQIHAQSGLVVNEFSQGSPGQEWIELVVVGDCEVDLRGWIIDDNNGIFTDCGPGNNIEHGTFSGHGVAPGHLRFSNNPTWAAVKAGTVIVVYDDGAFTGTLPTGESANVGDPTDSNCDLLRWCPINSTGAAYFNVTSSSPSTGGSSGCDCVTNNAPQGNFSYAPATTPITSGSWAQMGLRNGGDGVQVRPSDGSFFHGFSYGSPGSCGTTFGGGPDGIHFASSGASFTYQFLNTTNDDYRLPGNFQALTSASNESPGEANNCDNAQWINTLRHPIEDFFYPGCINAVEVVNVCVGQTSTLSIPLTSCLTSSWSYGGFSTNGGFVTPLLGTIDPINGTIDVIGTIPGNLTLTFIATQDNSSIYSGSGCSSPPLESTAEITFSITVGSGPTASPAFITACEESGGNTVVDLTSVDPTVGGGLQVDWFLDNATNNPIANPTAFPVSIGSTSVWAIAVDGQCISSPVEVQIAVTSAPDAFGASITDCAAPGASSTTVDLTALELTITGNNPSNNVTFYTDPSATNIINTPTGFSVNVGSPTTIYAVVDDGACTSGTVPIGINIFASPNLVSNGTIEICAGDPVDLSTAVTETTGSGATLLFYGNGSCTGAPIPANQNPTNPGANFYCVQATSGICTDDQQIVVIVTPGGTPTMSTASLCDTDPLFDLTTLEDPLFPGGTWTGTNVTGTDFDPTGLNGTITLTYTPTDCGNVTTTTIDVGPAGVPSLGSASICSTDGIFDLSTLADSNYPTGIWSGDYVAGNTFDPSQAGSNETVTLTFAPSASCAATATTTIDITITQTPTLGTATLCESDGLLDLTTLEDTNFPGGTWSGTGVTGSNFDPTGLNGSINLTYVPAAGGVCILDGTTTLTVNTLQTPALVPADVCISNTSFDLSSLEDNNFPGGTWSGPGVTGILFDATGQSGSITLDYVANENCTALASTMITIIDAPTADVVTELCNAANTEYTVTIEISGGDNASYTIDGNAVVGTTFTSAPIPTGSSYSFTLDDINNCDPSVVSGSFTCNCTTDAGNIDFSTAITLCDSLPIDVGALYGNDFVDDGDDVLNFIIHDAADASLGNVIAINNSSVFNYPTGIPLNTVVYISPIAGNNDGTGLVDLTDPCLSVAQGVAVQVISPDITFSVTSPICEEACIPVTITIGNTGVSPGNPIKINYTLSDGPNDQFGLITLESDTTVTIEICESETLSDGIVSLSFTDADFEGCTIDYGTSQTSLIDILAPGIQNIIDTLCEDASITILGATFDINQPSGELKLGGQAFNGCDSVININLSFFDPDTNFIAQTLCTGGSLIVNGTTYDETNPSGIETLIGGNSNGCDSTINVSLTFLTEITFEIDSLLCTGASITVNGNLYDAANPTGSETFVNGSFLGCDSIVNINLSFISDIITDINSSLCLGETVSVNGNIYDEVNPTGTEIMTSYQGCDSTINVTLSFFPEVINNLAPTLCSTDTLVVNGTDYFSGNATGTEVILGGSVNGCDSTINVSLGFFPVVINNLEDTLCSTDIILVNGTLYDINNPTGTENIENITVNGCDSTVNINLMFLPEVSTDIIQTLCANESVVVNSVTYDINNPVGTEIITGATINGCDSTVNVNLSFHPDIAGTEILDICTNGSAVYNGTTYDINNPVGTEILAGASFNGCDSTVNVSINLLPDATGQVIDELCPTESITVNGTLYDINNPTGTETFVNAAFNGCDSIVTITLDFFDASVSNQVFELCSDESVVVNGTTYDINNLTGTEILIGASSNGCDSTVNIQITPLADVVNDIDETLCEDESILINGVVYDINNPTGQEILEDASSEGCDSIINVSLNFFPTAAGTIDEELPGNGSITVNGVIYNINNPSGQEILINASINGCDSIVDINLSFIPELEATYSAISPSCAGDSNGQLLIETIANAEFPVNLSLIGPDGIPQIFEIGSLPFEVENLSAGSYTLSFIDFNGILLVENTFINDPSEYLIDAGGPYEVELGGSESISILPNFNLDSVVWTPSQYLNCDTCSIVVVSPEEDITYEILAMNDLGCITTTTVLVEVFNSREVYIPNVFSPNFDGINDVFTVHAGTSVKVIETLQVFDRWGNLIYQGDNLDPSNLNIGWDGSYRGQMLNPAVFAYFAIVEYLDGEREIYKGDVSLIR